MTRAEDTPPIMLSGSGQLLSTGDEDTQKQGKKFFSGSDEAKGLCKFSFRGEMKNQ